MTLLCLHRMHTQTLMVFIINSHSSDSMVRLIIRPWLTYRPLREMCGLMLLEMDEYHHFI